MADPLEKPLKWNKNFQVYVEKNNLYDVFQEILKEIIIAKPKDPLLFIKNHATGIAKGIYNPRAFIVGPKIAEIIGKRLANTVGAQFLSLDQIIKEASSTGQPELDLFANGIDRGDEESRKILVSIVQRRIFADDCEKKGYLLYGFPQSKAQAICAQKMGLLPRQVFVFLPDTRLRTEDDDELEGEIEGRTVDNMALTMTLSRSAMKNISPELHALLLKDISASYHYDICKVISFDKLVKTSKADLDSELTGILMTWKPLGSPFIPRVVIMGPPGSGKSSIAEFLCKKFSMVNLDWVELVRGAERWNDEIALEARTYLTNLVPMADEVVKTIISRRLQKPDCEKRGWILHGFPENIKHCKILETLYLEPNRIFMLSCSQELSAARMLKKKKNILKRELNGVAGTLGNIEKGNYLIFPFSEASVEKRFENFAKSLDSIIPHYGSRIIYVDAAMKPSDVKNFVETSIHRPPIPHNA